MRGLWCRRELRAGAWGIEAGACSGKEFGRRLRVCAGGLGVGGEVRCRLQQGHQPSGAYLRWLLVGGAVRVTLPGLAPCGFWKWSACLAPRQTGGQAVLRAIPPAPTGHGSQLVEAAEQVLGAGEGGQCAKLP